MTVLASQCGDKQTSKEAIVLCGLRQVHSVQQCTLDISYNSTFSKILWWKLSIAQSLLWAVKPVLTVSHFYLARRISKLKKMLLAVIVRANWRTGEQSWVEQLSNCLRGGSPGDLGNLQPCSPQTMQRIANHNLAWNLIWWWGGCETYVNIWLACCQWLSSDRKRGNKFKTKISLDSILSRMSKYLRIPMQTKMKTEYLLEFLQLTFSFIPWFFHSLFLCHSQVFCCVFHHSC